VTVCRLLESVLGPEGFKKVRIIYQCCITSADYAVDFWARQLEAAGFTDIEILGEMCFWVGSACHAHGPILPARVGCTADS